MPSKSGILNLLVALWVIVWFSAVHAWNFFFLPNEYILNSVRCQSTHNGGLAALNLSSKRRRRKKDESSSYTNKDVQGDDSLPDFDITEQNDDASTNSIGSMAVSYIPVSSGVVENMKSSSKTMGKKSLQELLADRSLETKFKFEEPSETTALPDLTLIESYEKSTATKAINLMPSNRKRDRRDEARRLAQLAADQERQEAERRAVLDKLPGIRDEKGNISGVKILETGTWACIISLIVWEIYINSPLFERAAPMTPIVY